MLKATQPKTTPSLYSSNCGIRKVDVKLMFDQPRICIVIQAKTTVSDTVHDAAGFADAMTNALVGGDYGTYGYSCAGALGFGSTGSWTNAFSNVSQHGSICRPVIASMTGCHCTAGEPCRLTEECLVSANCFLIAAANLHNLLAQPCPSDV